MKRRKFIALAGSAATWKCATWPWTARAQQPPKQVIGYLGLTSPGGEAEIIGAVRAGLAEAGLAENRIAIEFRYAEGDARRLPALADELVQHKVNLIFAGTTAALAAKGATATMPVVFVMGADPIKTNLVSALNHPGGNVTGITFFTNQMETKRLGLLHDLVPKAHLIAVLLNPNNPFFENQLADLTEASRALGIAIDVEGASDETEIVKAFTTFTQRQAGALLVGADLYFTSRRALTIEPAIELRLPAIYEWREFADAGGLMSYGTVLSDSFRQAGNYAARVLKGENPADIPVLQASKFQFVINLKTAKQIGIEVPPDLSARADDMIE
jgi:putative ABC transport system substrate-binding protein